jgi:hypothetical protein
MAVGYSVSTKVRPLVERWNGISWKILSTPRPGRAWWYELTDVSCPGTGDCTAVGGAIGRGVDAQERPLAEHWGGGSWTIQRTPNPHAENGSDLTAVSCPATGVCEAAGGYTFADVEDSIFALGWNGSKWTIQAQPDPGGGFVTENDAVSCATGMACTSTGSWADEQGRTRALGETWDGTSWTLRNAKDPSGSTIAELLGVACAGAAECIAVGDWSTSYNGTPSSTLGERWNGTAWRVQSTPNPKGSTFSSLRGVECASTGACVAVGSSHVDGVDATLVEVYTP